MAKDGKDAAKAHQEVYEKALSLVVSKNKDTFSLEKEQKEIERYGNTTIGRGTCWPAS